MFLMLYDVNKAGYFIYKSRVKVSRIKKNSRP